MQYISSSSSQSIVYFMFIDLLVTIFYNSTLILLTQEAQKEHIIVPATKLYENVQHKTKRKMQNTKLQLLQVLQLHNLRELESFIQMEVFNNIVIFQLMLNINIFSFILFSIQTVLFVFSSHLDLLQNCSIIIIDQYIIEVVFWNSFNRKFVLIKYNNHKYCLYNKLIIVFRVKRYI